MFCKGSSENQTNFSWFSPQTGRISASETITMAIIWMGWARVGSVYDLHAFSAHLHNSHPVTSLHAALELLLDLNFRFIFNQTNWIKKYVCVHFLLWSMLLMRMPYRAPTRLWHHSKCNFKTLPFPIWTICGFPSVPLGSWPAPASLRQEANGF